MFTTKRLALAMGTALALCVAVSYVALPFDSQWMALVVGAPLTACIALSYVALPCDSLEVTREARERSHGGDKKRRGDRQRRGSDLTAESPAELLAANGSGHGKNRTSGGSGCDGLEVIVEHSLCSNANAVSTATPLQAVDLKT